MKYKIDVLNDFDKKLASMGWVPLSEKGAERRQHIRYKNESGEYGYLKYVDPEGAFCELLAETLARAVGIPCLKNYILPVDDGKSPAFARLSIAPAQEHAPMRGYYFSNANVRKQIASSLSGWLALAEFVGHTDFHPGNIIVYSGTEKDKEIYNTYPIDFEGLDFRGIVDLRDNGKIFFEKKYFPIDEKAYRQGKKAIDDLGESYIISVIEKAHAYCGLSELRKLEYLPPKEDIITHLCAKYWANNSLPGSSEHPRSTRSFTNTACVFA
jgi:hypothetical protein